MFHSLPSGYEHLVDIDHVDCPKSSPLGHPEVVRGKLRPHGLDIAWNMIGKQFVFFRWTKCSGWPHDLPAVVWQAVNDDGPIPMDDELIKLVVELHNTRVSDEKRILAEQLAEKDKIDREHERSLIQADDTLKRVLDHAGVGGTGHMLVPEMPK